MPLKIAGIEPDEESLRRKAAGYRHVKLIGALTGERMIGICANALAAVCTAYDEIHLA